MKLEKLAGATSEIWQIFIRDSSSTTGAGLTGLTNASGSLTAYYHRDTDTTATVINLVSMTVGTFTSSGFKEIDATNMPGWYQFCPPNAAIASGAKSCAFLLKGATNMAPLPIEVQLVAVNPDSATAFITGVNSLAPLTAAQIATGVWQDTTASDFTTALSVGKSVMNGVSLGTGLTVNDITTKTGYSLSSGGITAIWQDSTAADFTAANSIGKSIMNGVALGTGLTVNAVTGLTASNLDATISSRMATYTQPTGFLAATFPSGTVANTTNITAGTITTATNLTTNNDKTGYALTAGERNSVADAILDRDMSTGADSGSTTVRTVRQALRFLRNKWSIAAGTLTVTKEDDVTASWTSAITTTAGDPVSASDPAGP